MFNQRYEAMKFIGYAFLFVVVFFSQSSYAQADDDGMIERKKEEIKTREYGKKYLEDQFYLGFTYDYFAAKARNVVQHNLSRGIHLGMLRDIPLNERRNMGFAVGLGYSYSLIYSNLVSFSVDNVRTYYIAENLSDLNINKNYLEMHTIEVPLEFRWRTSTAEKHKFARVYSGIRLGYVAGATSLYRHNELTSYFNNPDVEKKWHFKVFTVFGYNTWNFFVQYNLTPIFKGVTTEDGTSLKSSVLQMGLMFYIL